MGSPPISKCEKSKGVSSCPYVMANSSSGDRSSIELIQQVNEAHTRAQMEYYKGSNEGVSIGYTYNRDTCAERARVVCYKNNKKGKHPFALFRTVAIVKPPCHHLSISNRTQRTRRLQPPQQPEQNEKGNESRRTTRKAYKFIDSQVRQYIDSTPLTT
jgi:hypothetical protein